MSALNIGVIYGIVESKFSVQALLQVIMLDKALKCIARLPSLTLR